MSANSAVVDGSMSDCYAFESKSLSIPKVEVAKKVEPESSGLENPIDLEDMKGITLREPLYAIHEDKDNNSGGGCDDEADKAVKTLLALNEHKDNNSCGGSDEDTEGDDNDDSDDISDDVDNEEVSEKNFDCCEPKLDAAEAIQVA